MDVKTQIQSEKKAFRRMLRSARYWMTYKGYACAIASLEEAIIHLKNLKEIDK